MKKKGIVLEKFREFTKDSKVREQEVLEFGRKVSTKARKKHKV